MNIWQYLGYEKEVRPSEKTTMKVKNFDEVPESKLTWPMRGQIKEDGVYLLMAKDNDSWAAGFSRTGKEFTNIEDLCLEFHRYNETPGIYIAELCNDGCSLEALSGMINPNRNKPLSPEQVELMKDTYMVFHDYLTIDEFVKGECTTPHPLRHSRLDSLLSEIYKLSRSEFLWSIAEVEAFAKDCIEKGHEGAVFKPEHGWLAGHKGYRMMKKVRGVDYDLLCTGVEEGKGKYAGKVANLYFRWKNDTEIKAMLGKGWTHLDAEMMWENRNYHKLSPIGKIFHVHALQESSKGKLRLPKVGELRIDKTVADI